MEALYDTVDGLTVEKGSYIAVVAKDLSAGFWESRKKPVHSRHLTI